jgi:hypothetical protein
MPSYHRGTLRATGLVFGGKVNLLQEIKDSRSPICAECNCYRNTDRTGIADYFIRLNKKWVPVEAKLNVLAEQDLRSQVAKYTNLDSFCPTLGSSIGSSYHLDDDSHCLVLDQSGIYVTYNGEFKNCSINEPLIRREDVKSLGTGKLRERVLRAIS